MIPDACGGSVDFRHKAYLRIKKPAEAGFFYPFFIRAR
jgi:hypothetical protein